MGTDRNYKSHLELGSSWGMVCPLYMHSICATGITSRDCMSLAIILKIPPWIIDPHFHPTNIIKDNRKDNTSYCGRIVI
jgi:hypothetical protein